ncbi:MAG: hypothetical protein WCK31_02450, partial [bacterium]
INIYSRDFTDKSTTDPDVLRSPKDFLNTTYQVPNSAVKALMSPAGSRIELENKQLSLKTLGNLSTPYNTGGSNSKLLRASGTDDSGMTSYTVYASNVNDAIGQGGAIPEYKNYTNIKTDKVQFNASEILSEEAAISRAQLEQQYFVSCSNITEYDKNLIGAGGKPMVFKNNDYPIAVNYDQDYSHGRCDGYPEGGAPGVDFKVTDGNGAVVTNYAGLDARLIPPGAPGSAYKDNHLTTISKDCYRAWCQLASNKRKVDTHPEFNGGGGANASAYASGGSQFAFAYFPLTKDYSFMSKIQTGSANVLSGSGMMRILRTAWEQSSRLQYKLTPVVSTQTGTTTNVVATNSAYRLCHKNISVQAKVYTRNYTVAAKQEEYYTGNLDQCYNPNNHVQWSYKRSSLKPEGEKTYTISTTEFPWLGTVAAINERISKSDYFYKNTGQGVTNISDTKLDSSNLAALELKRCGLMDATDPMNNSTSDMMCYCEPDQKDPLAIYLCQNGWLTESEKNAAGLTTEDCQKPETFSVNGKFLYGNSGQKMCEAYNDPKVQEIFTKLQETSGVPKELLASVWKTESGCGLPTGSTDLLNGTLQEKNNMVCTRCNLEGAGRSISSLTEADQIDQNLSLYNACLSADAKRKETGTNHSCLDAPIYTKNNELTNVVQCCDVRGATQFEIGTWNGIIKDSKYTACRNALGEIGLNTSGTPKREVFGDSLCASMTKFSNDNGGGSDWSDANIFKVAQSYFGGSSCLSYTDYQTRLSNGPKMSADESYCGMLVDLFHTIKGS